MVVQPFILSFYQHPNRYKSQSMADKSSESSGSIGSIEEPLESPEASEPLRSLYVPRVSSSGRQLFPLNTKILLDLIGKLVHEQFVGPHQPFRLGVGSTTTGILTCNFIENSDNMAVLNAELIRLNYAVTRDIIGLDIIRYQEVITVVINHNSYSLGISPITKESLLALYEEFCRVNEKPPFPDSLAMRIDGVASPIYPRTINNKTAEIIEQLNKIVYTPCEPSGSCKCKRPEFLKGLMVILSPSRWEDTIPSKSTI